MKQINVDIDQVYRDLVEMSSSDYYMLCFPFQEINNQHPNFSLFQIF